MRPAPTCCPCCGGTNLSKIGEDVIETLDVVPRLLTWLLPVMLLIGNLHVPRVGTVNRIGAFMHFLGDPIDAMWSLLTKAEVLRHLGAFKAAQEVLAHVGGPQYAEVVARFRELCSSGDCCVRLLR